MARRIVITGAGSGLGRAIARRLADEPSQFELVGRRTDRLDETARLLRQASPEASVSAHSADLRDPDAVQQLAEDLADGPTVDVLVLNAGGSFGKGGDSLAEVAEDWRTDFEGNVLTTVLLG